MRKALPEGNIDPVSDFPLQVALPARAGGGAGPRHSSPRSLPPEPLTLRLLGRFTARRGGQEMDPCAFASGDGARLVRFLLVHREHAVSESEVLGGLWPDARPVQAICNLRHSPWAAAWRERLCARRSELLHALAELPGYQQAARATAAAS